MRKKNIIGFIAIVAVAALVATLAICGFGVGIYNVVPIPSLVLKGVELDGGTSVLFRAADPEDGTDMDEAMDVVVEKQKSRLEDGGYTDAIVTRQSNNGVLVEMPKSDNTDSIVEYLGSVAEVTFKKSDGTVILSGKNITDSVYGYSTDENQTPSVSFMLDEESTKSFAEATAAMIGENLSIYIDEQLITTAQISEPITTGVVSISTASGGIEKARQLSGYITSGTLPVELEIEEMRTMQPVMNANETTALFLLMGAAALLTLVVFAASYKFLPGFAAWFVIMLDMLVFMLVLPTVGSLTFTLSCFFACAISFVLATYMMARILSGFRNAVNSGSKPKAAWKSATDAAFLPIILVAGSIAAVSIALLFSPVTSQSNFGRVLLVGTLTDTFIGLFAINWMMKLVFNIAGANTESLVKPEKEKKTLAIAGALRKRSPIVAVALILVGAIVAIAFGFNMGTDMAGGSSVTITAGAEKIETVDIEEALKHAGIADYEIDEVIGDNDPDDALATDADDEEAEPLTASASISTTATLTAEETDLVCEYLSSEAGYANVTAGTINIMEASSGPASILYAYAAAIGLAIVTSIVLFVVADKRYALVNVICSVVGILMVTAFVAILRLGVTRTTLVAVVMASVINAIALFGTLVSAAKTERPFSCAATVASIAAIACGVAMALTFSPAVIPLAASLIVSALTALFIIRSLAYEVMNMLGGEIARVRLAGRTTKTKKTTGRSAK